MYMNDYQTAARRTAMGCNLDHFVMGLTEEAGEVAGVMKRFHRGDASYCETKADFGGPKVRLSAEAKVKLIDECGDTLWYIAMIADELDTTLEELAQRNINKLADRAKRKVIQGSGDNR